MEHYDSLSSKVLIVDDEDVIRKGLVFLLRKEGYEPLEAKDGREAIDLVFAQSAARTTVI